MSVNEMDLAIGKRKFFVSNRVLGAFGLVGAPMLLGEMLTRFFTQEPEQFNEPLVAALGIFYMGGWIASAIGMRRLRATGDGLASQILFAVQIVLLALALLFSVQETFGVRFEPSGVFFAVTDAAYPFSHLLMITVGVFVWWARAWHGLSRIAPFIVGIALPLLFAAMPFIGMAIGGVIFAGLTAIGLGLIACAVFNSD